MSANLDVLDGRIAAASVQIESLDAEIAEHQESIRQAMAAAEPDDAFADRLQLERDERVRKRERLTLQRDTLVGRRLDDRNETR